MASIRFPGKILFPFFGYPMIEHVRRRALLSKKISDVYVATCDQKIADAVIAHGGKVILTGDHHRNGTSRVAEAVTEIEASHIILLQGDEPLLLPSYVDSLVDAIAKELDEVGIYAVGARTRAVQRAACACASVALTPSWSLKLLRPKSCKQCDHGSVRGK